MRRPLIVGIGLGMVRMLGALAALAGPTAKVPAPAPAAKIAREVPMAPVLSGLAISFVIEPVVGAKPPSLAVTVRNNSAQAVPFMRFTHGACFVHYLLNLQIKKPDGKPMSFKPCFSTAWPGVDGKLAAQSSERFLIPFSELADPWPLGTYAIAVEWNPAELQRVRSITVPTALQTSLNASSFSILKPVGQLRIQRGQTVTLPDGVRFTFSGHSHKDVSPGQSSPLIIYGSFAGTTQDGEFSVNLYPEISSQFTVGDDRAFDLGKYGYGDWMALTYYGRVPPPPQ